MYLAMTYEEERDAMKERLATKIAEVLSTPAPTGVIEGVVTAPGTPVHNYISALQANLDEAHAVLEQLLKERDEARTALGCALSLAKNAEFNQAEYAKRCDEIADLRRRLLETERAGEDIREKNATLLYERDRARELLEQASLQFNRALAERESLKDALEIVRASRREYVEKFRTERERNEALKHNLKAFEVPGDGGGL